MIEVGETARSLDERPRRRQAPAGELPPLRIRLLVVDDIADNRVILARRFQRRGYRDGRSRSAAARRSRSSDPSRSTRAARHQNARHGRARSPAENPRDEFAGDAPGDHVSPPTTPAPMSSRRWRPGANDYVAKPVDFAVALARINAQVERKRRERATRRGQCGAQRGQRRARTARDERTQRAAR